MVLFILSAETSVQFRAKNGSQHLENQLVNIRSQLTLFIFISNFYTTFGGKQLIHLRSMALDFISKGMDSSGFLEFKTCLFYLISLKNYIISVKV